ncbi:hypothetical protein MKQ68_15910 [Chitinophaga horti]|uniref:Uncharacterized protein n=1 Tax=Chitinophaga horti TaxID=2920382 RepID=A0ABY6J0A4_9BACT|nr:hypothetical protein [Chitinophaga horti]UYQ91577.1 hypothetical protein MKQ68_15910 [Chitinophaga horti]
MYQILSTTENRLFNFETATTGILTYGEYTGRLIAGFKPATFSNRPGYVVVRGEGYAAPMQNVRLTLNLYGMFSNFAQPREIALGVLNSVEGQPFTFEVMLPVRPNYNYSDDGGDALSTMISGTAVQQQTIYGGIKSDGDSSYFMTLGWRALGDEPAAVPAYYI